MYARDSRMLREELCDFHCIFRVRAHAPRQCAHPAQDQPAIERRGDRAALVLDAADPLKKFIILFRNDDSSKNITMSAEIFRGGMQDEIGAEIEWSLQHRRPGVVANEKRAGVV